MNKFFLLFPLYILTSSQAFAFKNIEGFIQLQHAHLVREYEAHFLMNNENNSERSRSSHGLDAKATVIEAGVRIPIFRDIKLVGEMTFGDDGLENKLWISQYSLDNTIGTEPNYGGYNEYPAGHLRYRNYKVGLEQQKTDLLTTGVYIATESLESRSGTLHSSPVAASSYLENSVKLEGYTDIRSKTALPNVSVGVQNIFILRRTNLEQTFWSVGTLNFNAPSLQILSSPYVIVDVARNISVRMSLTHTVFKSLRQKDVEYAGVDRVSNVGVDGYSGSQTNFALNANYKF